MSGRVTPDEATAFRRHMVLEMARMSCDDGLVMTLHPGVQRNHHPATFAGFGARHRARHPRRGGIHQMRCSRCWSATALTRTCTWCCSPWTPTSSAGRSHRWPDSTRRVYVGAPWWFLDNPIRDPVFPAIGHRDRRAVEAFRVHRRHPGVLLHPGPARHVPPAGRRFPGRTGRRAPTGRGRGLDSRRPGRDPVSS